MSGTSLLALIDDIALKAQQVTGRNSVRELSVDQGDSRIYRWPVRRAGGCIADEGTAMGGEIDGFLSH
ncbi:MAG: hypothetical protein KA748_05800 [Halomonas sp.]|nr:hypothetical protein [Halomonas sp.]MBP5979698.1 hypothetical protein [Halomonas sp.]